MKFIIIILLIILPSYIWSMGNNEGPINNPDIILTIDGITCSLCSKAIEKNLRNTFGIKSAKIIHNKNAYLIINNTVDEKDIINSVEIAGNYTVIDLIWVNKEEKDYE